MNINVINLFHYCYDPILFRNRYTLIRNTCQAWRLVWYCLDVFIIVDLKHVITIEKENPNWRRHAIVEFQHHSRPLLDTKLTKEGTHAGHVSGIWVFFFFFLSLGVNTIKVTLGSFHKRSTWKIMDPFSDFPETHVLYCYSTTAKSSGFVWFYDYSRCNFRAIFLSAVNFFETNCIHLKPLKWYVTRTYHFKWIEVRGQ